ncbi:hypothetical protein SLEP1_g42944 [Rubroshorea leprosula]|uniref:Uncharacterized protein n=1 Tax=Rubroshorea leprosula TaxID=152421 RepID=A0AAV5LBG3_9ROSI|nr:hypothetical protein SLEP1_g42944 [Rubroshorea leprosula]
MRLRMIYVVMVVYDLSQLNFTIVLNVIIPSTSTVLSYQERQDNGVIKSRCASDALKFLTTSPIKDTSIIFSLTTSMKGNAVAVELEMVVLDARMVIFPCAIHVLCSRI